MRVFIIESNSLIAERDFDPHPVIVGSAPDCGIHLHDSRISGRHILLTPKDAAHWVAEPLETQTQALLNGMKLVHPQPLKELDEIVLGSYKLKFYFAFRLRELSKEPKPAARTTFQMPSNGIARHHTEPIHITLERIRDFASFTTEAAALCDTRQVVDLVLRQAISIFSAGIACLRLTQAAAGGREAVRCVDAKNEPVDPPALSNFLFEPCTHFLQRLCLPHGQTPGSPSAMAAPLIGETGAAMGMLLVESVDGQARYDTAALDALTAFAGAAAPPLDRAIHSTTAARAEFLNQQVVLARGVQDGVTPKAIPNWPGLQVAAYRRPGTVNCCDAYDLLRLASGTAAILLARVNGNGPVVPRLMAEMRAAFRCAGLHNDAPHVFARALNWLVGDGHLQATIDMACLWLAPDNGAIRYCVCGNTLFAGFVGEDGTWRNLEPCDQPSIGASARFAYNGKSVTLEPGETLAVGTSGADLLKNADGKAFGASGVRDCLCDLAGTGVSAMMADVVQEIDEHAQHGAIPDDVTLILARRE